MFEIVILIVVVLALALLATTVVITPQQHVRMIETFGKYSRIARAGLSFKLPAPIQSAARPFSMQIREIAENVSVKSSDNAFVVVPIRVQVRVSEGNAQDAFYKLDDAEGQIRSYVVNQVRSTASGLTFDDLFRSRDSFEADVESALKERMSNFGFVIENVLVDDPQPSEELRRAFDSVLAAQRLKEAATNEGEAARIKAVARAQAEGESLEIKGRAYAAFRKLVSEGNSEAITSFVGNTGISPDKALAFFDNINEMEAVRDAAEAGGRVVFVSGSAKPYLADPVTAGLAADRGGKI
jgi:regulator of protease activity HflC (stomatin/prohibitin superfamily)